MPQPSKTVPILLTAVLAAALIPACGGGSGGDPAPAPATDPAQGAGPAPVVAPTQAQLVEQGREIFRFDTFGDERQWTDALRMHEVIEQAVSPNVALSVGLKVDADAIPPAVAAAIQAGQVDLDVGAARKCAQLGAHRVDAVPAGHAVHLVGGLHLALRSDTPQGYVPNVSIPPRGTLSSVS